MKIRMFGDSVRLRLTQNEVEALAGGGAVESVVPFPGEAFAFAVQPSANEALEAHHAAGRLSILVPQTKIAQWASSSSEGIYADQPLEAGGTAGRFLRIAVEKDYRCIHKPDSPDNAGAFPNPLETKS